MGEKYLTLADLLKPGLRAVCVGIYPSPVSVEAGHYYQGAAGQRFFARLCKVGLLPASFAGFEDDAAFARGVGFTDIVKRPTRGEKDLRPGELAHGRSALMGKLTETRPRSSSSPSRRRRRRCLARSRGTAS